MTATTLEKKTHLRTEAELTEVTIDLFITANPFAAGQLLYRAGFTRWYYTADKENRMQLLDRKVRAMTEASARRLQEWMNAQTSDMNECHTRTRFHVCLSSQRFHTVFTRYYPEK